MAATIPIFYAFGPRLSAIEDLCSIPSSSFSSATFFYLRYCYLPQPAEVLFSVTKSILQCLSITQNTFQLNFNNKIQTFVKATKCKIL